jgi:hypothetical protein
LFTRVKKGCFEAQFLNDIKVFLLGGKGFGKMGLRKTFVLEQEGFLKIMGFRWEGRVLVKESGFWKMFFFLRKTFGGRDGFSMRKRGFLVKAVFRKRFFEEMGLRVKGVLGQ